MRAVGKEPLAPRLKHLDLSGMELSELPATINCVTSLRILCLKDCKNLKELPPLTRLEKLERLDVRGCEKLTGLPELPPQKLVIRAGGSGLPPSDGRASHTPRRKMGCTVQ